MRGGNKEKFKRLVIREKVPVKQEGKRGEGGFGQGVRCLSRVITIQNSLQKRVRVAGKTNFREPTGRK